MQTIFRRFYFLAATYFKLYYFIMPTVALQAHYDGQRIVLDEPYNLPTDAPLIVTVLPMTSEPDIESESVWLRALASNDAFSFLNDPAEDIYTVEDGEPFYNAV